MKMIFSAALLFAHIALPASAGTRISWSDLNLSTTSGADALHQRIEDAAGKACRFARKWNSRVPDTQNCRTDFRDEAMSLMPDHARSAYTAARSRFDSARPQ